MPRPDPLILAIGDSLIAGFGLRAEESFPAQLEAALRAEHPAARVVGAGVSGNTSGDVLRRLPGVLSRLAARPALAIVQAGPNDVLWQVPPARMRENLAAICRELGRCGVPVLLTAVTSPDYLSSWTRAYAGVHAAVAAEEGVASCPFYPPGVLGHPDMVLWDRIHPNARAIAAVIEGMLSVVSRLIGEAVVKA